MNERPEPAPSAVTELLLGERRRQRRKRRRFWLIVAVVLLLPPVVVASVFYYNRYQATAALDAAIAETDRLDPEWRLEQIEKKRLAIPDEENAAIPVSAAIALLPARWLDSQRQPLDLDQLPQRQFDLLLLEMLRKDIVTGLPAADTAQKARSFKQGAFKIAWSLDIIGTKFDHWWSIRQLTIYVSHLAILHQQDRKIDESVSIAMTQLALERAIGEEPTLGSHIAATFVKRCAVENLERTIAQGTASDAVLADAWQQFSDIAKKNGLFPALRGERASTPLFFAAIDNPKAFAGKVRPRNDPKNFTKWFATGGTLYLDHAWMLRFYNEALRCSELPNCEMLAGLKTLFSTRDEGPQTSPAILVPKLESIAEAEVRTQAMLQCTIAGIAVERFRLKHGRWPDSLDEVVAANLLDSVPQDPCDSKPLRFRKTSDGVVIYSVGLDGNYAGDLLDTERKNDTEVFSHRLEFRLWNENHRRQPAWNYQSAVHDDL